MLKEKSVEEIENDLRAFLETIWPIVELATSTQSKTLLMARLVKKMAQKDFVNFATLAPLLEKYQYLVTDDTDGVHRHK